MLVLASAQFLMTLDSSVMNVSIQYVAKDLNTTVTGIQTAITLYTLVMASFMITGGKIGARLGRRRTLALGLVVYGVGSAATAAAPNLGVLLLGWSVLEGLGGRPDSARHRGSGRGPTFLKHADRPPIYGLPPPVPLPLLPDHSSAGR